MQLISPASLENDVFPFLKRTVEDVLRSPHDREWTVQGFGMMRTYLDPHATWRLNVWHPNLMVEGVSVIHDHPWHFDSWVFGGELTNIRYEDLGTHDRPSWSRGAERFHVCEIHTGIESMVKDAGGREIPEGTTAIWLGACEPEVYGPVAHYNQAWNEIHKTTYTPGTVTLNRRVRVGEGNRARVFWPYGEEWVSAKPRKAMLLEINHYTAIARELISN